MIRELSAVWVERLRASAETFTRYRVAHPEERARLFEANLEWMDLAGVNLEGADLRRCCLEGCQLADADLTRTLM